jgi:hypothetical protein
MRAIFLEALGVMEQAFRDLENQVSPPKRQPYKNGFVFRYQERSIYQALLQKLARQISGLHGIDVLLLNGLEQERCVLQRTLDEIGEDIVFLSFAINNGELSDIHKQYLNYF